MRVKRGTKARARRNKVLKRAKGYYGSNSRLFVTAQEVVDRALVYAYRDRRQKKRHFRSLWTQRINAAARLQGLTYSKFIHGLSLAGILVDRKIMAELAVNEPTAFTELVKKAQAALPA